MSALIGTDHTARRRASERARVAARSRRSDEGSVTEMALALLRDARESEARRSPARRGRAELASSRTSRRGLQL
jgi:hypothetical protein